MTITDEQIHRLRAQARVDGDFSLWRTCRAALGEQGLGPTWDARARCAEILARGGK